MRSPLLPGLFLAVVSATTSANAAGWLIQKNEQDPFDKSKATFADVREESADVLSATNFITSVQFGDESTLDYLEGGQKISVRYTLGGATSTVSFSGGRSLNDVIGKARKACGLVKTQPEKAQPPSLKQVVQPSKPLTAGTGGNHEACESQFDRLIKSGDLGPNADEQGFLAWCNNPANQ